MAVYDYAESFSNLLEQKYARNFALMRSPRAISR